MQPPCIPPVLIAAQGADLIIYIEWRLAGCLTLSPLFLVNSLFSAWAEWQLLCLLPHACQQAETCRVNISWSQIGTNLKGSTAIWGVNQFYLTLIYTE